MTLFPNPDSDTPHAEFGQPQTTIEEHVYVILECLGLDPKSEGLKKTPHRVAKYLLEFCQPFSIEQVLGTPFSSQGHHNMVVQSNIPFRMICEHHLLPALGHAAIGYVPGEKIVGLSKLPRLVKAVGCERPSLQEYINDRIANVLEEYINPKGVIVVISSLHTCMACRGVAVPDVQTTTSSIRGVFRDVPHARAEFFSLIGNGGFHV